MRGHWVSFPRSGMVFGILIFYRIHGGKWCTWVRPVWRLRTVRCIESSRGSILTLGIVLWIASRMVRLHG